MDAAAVQQIKRHGSREELFQAWLAQARPRQELLQVRLENDERCSYFSAAAIFRI